MAILNRQQYANSKLKLHLSRKQVEKAIDQIVEGKPPKFEKKPGEGWYVADGNKKKAGLMRTLNDSEDLDINAYFAHLNNIVNEYTELD